MILLQSKFRTKMNCLASVSLRAFALLMLASASLSVAASQQSSLPAAATDSLSVDDTSATPTWHMDMAMELQSRYVWRGQALGGAAPIIAPAATLTFKGLSLGVWGTYSLGAEVYQELDWTLAYALWPEVLTLQLTDYSTPQMGGEYHYFDYAAHTTPHLLEGGLLISVPQTALSVSAFVNFFGADARRADGTLNYSIYVETAYALQSKCVQSQFSFAVGAAVNGEEGHSFYGNDGFSIVNVSVEARRALPLSSTLRLPLYVRLVANPCAGKLHCLAGTLVEF